MHERKRKCEGESEPQISWADLYATSTVTHHSLWFPSMLSHVSCSSAISPQQDTRHVVLQLWHRGVVWGKWGSWLPRDHVSTDLHYCTIKRLVYSSEVRELFLLSAPYNPASQASLCAEPSLCFLLKHHSYLASTCSYQPNSLLLLFEPGCYFQGLLKAKQSQTGGLCSLQTLVGVFMLIKKWRWT